MYNKERGISIEDNFNKDFFDDSIISKIDEEED